MQLGRGGIGLAVVLWAMCPPADAASVPVRVPAGNPVFRYLGNWREADENHVTIQPGSQVRFRLIGAAHLDVQPGATDELSVLLRKNGEPVWKGILATNGLEADGGSTGGVFSLIYLAARHPQIDPLDSEAAPATLRFRGLWLHGDARLEELPEMAPALRVDFVGDSITVGASIAGRTNDWHLNFDASRTFSFQLAEALSADYRIWAFGGARGGDILAYLPRQLAETNGDVPGIVFINVGANNRSLTEDAYGQLMRQLVDASIAACPQAKVVLLNFFRMTPNRLPSLRKLSQAYPPGTVCCFDARPYLVGYSDGGVHPDPESHAQLARALADWTRRELAPGVAPDARASAVCDQTAAANE